MELDLVSHERVYDHIHNEGFTWVMFRIIIVWSLSAHCCPFVMCLFLT
jgi:hypothetical protein